MTRVRNDLFDRKVGFNRGRPDWMFYVWYIFKCIFFLNPIPWPSSLRCFILRAFGARVGISVLIKPRVNIHFPWKLEIGNYSWIGEEVLILNFEKIVIGAHSCISQRAFLCGGNHDFRDEAMRYRNEPIRLARGVWIGAQCFVGPGVSIGEDAVIRAGSIVLTDQPAGMVCGGNPSVPLKARWGSSKA